jgi:hypothetical protein
VRSVAAAGDAKPGVPTRDARMREAPGAVAARTKRATGRGSTSASTGWQNAWSDSKKKCASCAAATAGAPEALSNGRMPWIGERCTRVYGRPAARIAYTARLMCRRVGVWLEQVGPPIVGQ